MKRFFIIAIAVIVTLITAIPVSANQNMAEEFVLNENQEITLPFDIVETAGYKVVIEYMALEGRTVSPKIALTWDSSYTGEEKDVYTLTRIWADVRSNERFKIDDYGNELSPSCVEKQSWQKIELLPKDENWDDGFNLTAGKHTLYIKMLEESVKIASIKVEKNTLLQSYSDYRSSLTDQTASGNTDIKPIHQEAELLHEKSNIEVAVTYDRTSPEISPNESSKIRYNILGGSSWAQAGQWVSYEVDVQTEGFYTLNIRYRQRIINGVDVRRRIRIDGEVLFDELDCVLFPATSSFSDLILGQNGDAYEIYLTKGKHIIQFEVVYDSLNDVISDFDNTLYDLNNLSGKINVIVGEGVDLNRDYDFVSAIPGISDSLKSAAKELTNIIKKLGANSEGEGSDVARIKEAVRLFEEMAERPNDIAKQIEYFRSELYDLAGVLSTMKTQPLELDYFELCSVNNTYEAEKSNIFEIVWFRIKAFLHSFAEDYSSMNSTSGKDALDVWISLGRDQAQVMNQLISEEFTPETEIPVNLSLVTTSIMTAIASGKAPDVALNLDSTNIASLYYRDALVDLSVMSNIDEILDRFHPSAMTAFTYNNAIYALPQTQSFQMIFYRTDIFKENGFSVPNTWDELYDLLNLMQNDGMQIGIGISEETFYMFLLQSGTSFFNEELTATNLTNSESVSAFSKWTELFTKYGIPKSYDATNRFRAGQMPMVIADYSFYKTLVISAPEIQNSFAMAPIPGVLTETGIDRSQNCSSLSGAVVVKKDGRDYTDAMKFLDWLTSDSVQEKYSFNSEIRVGISARVQTANINVLEKISWSGDELDALKGQWEHIKKIPITPAQYYISRNMNNAFRKVVYQYENPRDVIYRYSSEIDEELLRKRAELGLEEAQHEN